MTKMEMITKVNETIYEMDLSSIIAQRHGSDNYGLLICDLDEKIENLQTKLLEIFTDIDLQPNQTILEYIFDDMIYYCDEYGTCADCGKIIQLPQWDYSYYKDSVLMRDEWGDMGYYCSTCIKEENNLQAYLNYNKNNHEKWITMLSKEEMEQMGWKALTGEYENGMYGVSTISEDIYNKYRELYPENEYDLVFVRTDENPFVVNFVLMAKEIED